ncbi:nuclear transport factor 2 family protein [Sphingosinicella sp. BN140058]|uniref:nuclear transport factor 2 family protein n=1 Tax=Sphingosinicella sp. BN140058 TaxID=1892855 RepID=UPI00101055D3|nr:nuclear transport factor 2 family protein [Sphingosinicella sp. BN140058]QAY77546.1 nuclear transport factor 2 family protein [Sphingosinicella sp. BN140058]
MKPTPELAIRLARATFNRAIAEADLAAIAPLLAKGAILVTGTDSAVIAGRKPQLATWERDFASPHRLVYTRLADAVTISPVEPIALEQGRWHGVPADGGAPAASGVYTAKWRQIDSDWVIEAELYVTLA